MLSRLIIYFAYFLKTSKSYRRIKRFFYNLLENPRRRSKYYFDLSMIVLVIISVILLIYNVKTRFDTYFLQFEHVVVSIFIVEYLLRLWLHGNIHEIIIDHYEKTKYLNIPFRLHRVILDVLSIKLGYIFTPVALIDLLAIFPSYRSLRILRVFLIFRLFKLFRYYKSVKIFGEILASKRVELYTLSLFLAFIVFISSTAIYLFENEASGGQVRNLFDGVYWSLVTISTVGYGDITPQTTGGRVITMALILTSIGILSIFTSIFVSAFNDKMQQLSQNRIYAELEKFRNFVIICGYGRVGEEVSLQLQKDRQNFIIIERDQHVASLAKQQGILVIHGDASSDKTLLAAGINRRASAIICTTDNDVNNVYITLSSRHLNPDIIIISRANQKDNEKKLVQAGANHVFYPYAIVASVAAEYIGKPVASHALMGILMEEKNIVLETVDVDAGSLLEGLQIGELNFALLKLSLVGVISSNLLHQKHRNQYQVHKQHFYFNPEAHFTLQADDILVLLGRNFSIDHFKDLVQKSLLKPDKL